MPYCIVVTERHPDAIIDDVIGPIEDRDIAEQEAKRLDEAPENYNRPYDSKYFRYDVREMTPKA